MPERPSDPAEPRSHRGGPLVTALRALFAIAVFLSVVRVLDNEFGLAGAAGGGCGGRRSAVVPDHPLGIPAQEIAAACRRFM